MRFSKETHHHVVGDVDVRLGAVEQNEGDVVVVVGLLPGRERVAVGVVAGAELDLALAARAAAGAAAVARRRPRGAVGHPQWTHLRHWYNSSRAPKQKYVLRFCPSVRVCPLGGCPGPRSERDARRPGVGEMENR